MKTPTLAFLAAFLLTACGGLFKTQEVMPTVYELRAGPVPAATARIPVTLEVARPRTRPGLDTDRIAVTLADRRLDAYGSSRWSAMLPALVESVLIDGLRSSGGWQAVVPARSAFGGRYLLQPEIASFEADYSGGTGAPTIHVHLIAELGQSSERQLVAIIEGQSSIRAAADRQRDVTAAFQAACAEAVAQLIGALNAAAAAAEQSAKSGPPAGS